MSHTDWTWRFLPWKALGGISEWLAKAYAGAGTGHESWAHSKLGPLASWVRTGHWCQVSKVVQWLCADNCWRTRGSKFQPQLLDRVNPWVDLVRICPCIEFCDSLSASDPAQPRWWGLMCFDDDEMNFDDATLMRWWILMDGVPGHFEIWFSITIFELLTSDSVDLLILFQMTHRYNFMILWCNDVTWDWAIIIVQCQDHKICNLKFEMQSLSAIPCSRLWFPAS